MQKEIEKYKIRSEQIEVTVRIISGKKAMLSYELTIPRLEPATKALLDEIRSLLITEVTISTAEMLDPKSITLLKEKFSKKAIALIQTKLPKLAPDVRAYLVGILLQEMLGLGPVEFLLNDPGLEEIVVTSAKESIRVYHKKHGWMETNITIPSEDQIQNYSSIIARRVGRQITTLTPLLDAHLVTGDRANAVLYPVCTKGNTITIRKFARDPWTVTDFVNNKTCPIEIFALIWHSIQYEMNILVSGGTASGKTSFLNVILPFIPPNQRVISIEDTRELQLSEHLYWCPLVTRQPNPEGKGEVCMFPGSYIVDGDGQLHEISELIESKFKENGSKKIKDNVEVADNDRFSILAGDPTKLTYNKEKVKSFSKITNRKFIYEVICKDGTKFKITENTKLPIAKDSERIHLLKPSEIEPKKHFIPLLTKINIRGDYQKINIFDTFENGFFYACDIKDIYEDLEAELRKKYTLNKLAKICGIKRQAFRWYKKKGLIRISILKKLIKLSSKHSLNEVEKKIKLIKPKGNTGFPIKIPKKIDEDFAYLAGFILAEKFITNNRVLISQKEEISYVLKDLVKKLFNYDIKHRKEEYNQYGLFSSVISRLMKNVFCADKSNKIKVPPVIMKSPDTIIASFLAGYIDGDGSIGKGRVSLATANERAIKEFKYLLLRLGIMSRIYYSKRTIQLNMHTREDAIRACKLLPFRLKKNIEKAKLNLETKFKEGTFRNRIPARLFNNYILNLKEYLNKEERYKYFYRYLEKDSRTMSKIKLDNLYTILAKRVNTTPKQKQSLKALSELTRKDIEFIEIKEVNKIKNTKNIPSYDLTPEKSEYFVAGNGNFTLVQDTMLDLLINSLRMRPDRIILGEMRRKDQAQVLFEAMHTGHSVYATVHADTIGETIKRLIHPPIEVPSNLLSAVNLNVVMFRDRRKGIRRVLQVGEYIAGEEEGATTIKPNILYRWKPDKDEIVQHSDSLRLREELSRFTGMTQKELNKELKTKEKILTWLVEQKIRGIDQVGEMLNTYYTDPNIILKLAEKNKKFKTVK